MDEFLQQPYMNAPLLSQASFCSDFFTAELFFYNFTQADRSVNEQQTKNKKRKEVLCKHVLNHRR